MNLYISVSQLWEDMKLNHLAKYGAITAATVISKFDIYSHVTLLLVVVLKVQNTGRDI